jgi:hypothetical protein
MVGSTLGVYSFGLIVVSAGTNKRHHHHHHNPECNPQTSTHHVAGACLTHVGHLAVHNGERAERKGWYGGWGFQGKMFVQQLFRNIFSMFFSSKKEWTAGGTIRKLKTKLNPRAPFAAAHSNIVPLN